jgi:hypothetical protein
MAALLLLLQLHLCCGGKGIRLQFPYESGGKQRRRKGADSVAGPRCNWWRGPAGRTHDNSRSQGLWAHKPAHREKQQRGPCRTPEERNAPLRGQTERIRTSVPNVLRGLWEHTLMRGREREREQRRAGLRQPTENGPSPNTSMRPPQDLKTTHIQLHVHINIIAVFWRGAKVGLWRVQLLVVARLAVRWV